MTKAQIERLIELERGQVDGSLEDQDLIDLGRLRQEFETWQPALILKSHSPNQVGTYPPKCNCNEPWFGVQPRWCPVHGLVSRVTVTCCG
jgi:hypothetical protein